MKEDHRSAETQPFQLWKKIFLWQMHSDNLIISCNDALYNSSELPVIERFEEFLWVSIAFSTVVIIEDASLNHVTFWWRDRHFRWSSEPSVCKAQRQYLLFLGYFKTGNICPVTVAIEPARDLPLCRDTSALRLPTELVLPRTKRGLLFQFYIDHNFAGCLSRFSHSRGTRPGI